MPGNGTKPGPTNPSSKGPSFVAEVSSNHHRDLERCLEFIRTAANIGCDAVKFQLFRVRELFAPEALRHNPKLLAREEWELPVEFLPRLAKGCAEAGIRFSCTPFYLEAVEELLPFVDFYKVASYELMWDDLLNACARTGKPVVLSTGMATLPEVSHACSILRGAGCRDLTLLHCVSSYPAKPEDCNLAAMATYARLASAQWVGRITAWIPVSSFELCTGGERRWWNSILTLKARAPSFRRDIVGFPRRCAM